MEQITTAAAVTEYLRVKMATREFSKATARTTRYVLHDFTKACPHHLDQVRSRHVVKWMELQASCQPSTVASRYGSVRSFLGWCSATGRLTKDPSHGITGPKRPRRRPRALDEDQVLLLLDSAPTPRLRLAVSLMVNEGLRLNEVATLQVGDVDWRHEMVTVIGKGNKQRDVHLTPTTANALALYLAENPATVGPLIRSEHDGVTPISAGHLGRIVTAHMRDAGVKRANRDGKSPHAFRHTYGSDLVDAGLTLPETADLMGHASIETTMMYQRHVSLDRTRSKVIGRSYARPGGKDGHPPV